MDRAACSPGALGRGQRPAGLPRLFFAEPSPGPVKHWFWRQGLIDSPEMRLPMVPVSDELAARIDRAVAEDIEADAARFFARGGAPKSATSRECNLADRRACWYFRAFACTGERP
ncbi:hypothetical protein [Ensifer adhaerens]|uniref:hypothetical protein n=1 Tax=Ensifer adhaerens TaxID=106592 RepID=UPI003F7EBF6D